MSEQSLAIGCPDDAAALMHRIVSSPPPLISH